MKMRELVGLRQQPVRGAFAMTHQHKLLPLLLATILSAPAAHAAVDLIAIGTLRGTRPTCRAKPPLRWRTVHPAICSAASVRD